MPAEPIAVTLLVIDALEALHVPYLIGGSFAAAVYGVARMTADPSTWMLNRYARLFGIVAVSV